MNKLLITILTLCLLGCGHLFAQQDDSYPVRVIADARDGEIRLRWAPTDFDTWEKANATGYRLERLDAAGNPRILAENLRPLPLNDWEPIGDTLELAFLYAGALYSETFQNEAAMGVETAEDQLSVEQNRYSMSLFIADQFFVVSLAAGLGYIDRDVQVGKRYVYRVTINNFTPLNQASEGTLLSVNADDRTILPPPAKPGAQWDNLVAKVGWNQSVTNTNYSSYRLERSANDGPFEPVNPFPIVYIETDENKDPNLYFTDSLVANDIEYTYRVRGRSPFGILGPPSPTVSGSGRPLPLAYPARISEMIQTPDNEMRINWQLSSEAEGRVTGFDILRSRNGRDDFQRVNPRRLGPEVRTYVDPDPRSGWFYFVTLTDDNGHEVIGPSGLLVLEDNDPPSPPIGLEGEMDSLGNVTIRWLANNEPDHQGYRVFMANQKDARFVQVTKDAILDLFYQHEVTMETTTESVFFAVKAVDYFGNYSLLSSPVEVERPDLIPPVGAVFRELVGSTEGVEISWSSSPSKDVVAYALQRKLDTESEAAYATIFSTDESVSTYFDTDLQRGQTYTYRLVVEDDAGWTTPGRAATAGRIDNGERAKISNLTATDLGNQSVSLSFSCRYPTDPSFFQVFRSIDGASITTLRTLKLDDPELNELGAQRYEFVDQEVRSGNRATYRLLARYPDGGFTPLTEPIELTIK